jgi:tetratricopeptide (TPR) repeat protein
MGFAVFPIALFIIITEPIMLKKIYLLFAVSLLNGLLYGVNTPYKDSIINAASKLSAEDSIDFILKQSASFISSNPNKAYAFAEKANQMCKQNKFEYELALSDFYKGKAKVELEDYYQAKKYLHDALPYFVSKKDKYKEADTYYSIAISCYYLGEYEESLKKNMDALHIYNKLNKKQDAANTLQNIGLIHHALDDLNKATYYYEQSLEINKELFNDTNIAGLYQNLGIIRHLTITKNQSVFLKS